MKGQDEPQPEWVYDVYLTRGTEAHFSKRYKTEAGAKARCEQLDDVWNRVGYKSWVKTVMVKPHGPEI